MNELRRKVAALLEANLGREVLVDLLIDVVARGLGRLGGRPRNGTLTHTEFEVSEPVTKHAKTSISVSSSESGSSGSPELSLEISERTKPEKYSADFVQFWALYPRKVGKAEAWRAWRRLKPPLGKVRDALAWQVKTDEWRKDGGSFIPYPASYLNAGRWEDEKQAALAPPRPRTPEWKPSPPPAPWPKESA